MAELVAITPAEHKSMEELEIALSGTIKEKGSLFTAYAAATTSLTEVRRVYRRIRIHPGANHVVVACKTSHNIGCHDDGEFSAGLRIQKLLELTGAQTTPIFMVRYYGRTLLGLKRFQNMDRVSKDALEALVDMQETCPARQINVYTVDFHGFIISD